MVTPFGDRFQVHFHSNLTIYKVSLKVECSLVLEEDYRADLGWGVWGGTGYGRESKAVSIRMRDFMRVSNY